MGAMAVRAVSLLLLAACQVHPDYAGTHYRCDDGRCPSGYTCIADQCVTGATPGDGSIADVIGVDTADADTSLSWWDTSYGHRAPLEISDVAPDALPVGFQIGVHVDLGALDSPSASWDALRVVRWDGSTWTEKPRFLEGGGLVRTVWFSLDAQVAAGTTTGDYWLYFTNPSPTTAPSNGAGIFDFFDDFTGTTIDTTKWATLGTPTQNAIITLKPSDSVRTKIQFAPGHAVTGSMTAQPNQPRFWIGYQRVNDFTDADPWLIWMNRAANDSDAPPQANPATIWPETYLPALGMNNPDWGPAQTLDGTRHYYTVQRMVDRAIYKYDEQMISMFALPSNDTSSMQVRLSDEGGANITFGVVYVRQAVVPDPAVSIGATETQH